MACQNTLGECCGEDIPNCPGWTYGDESYTLTINPSTTSDTIVQDTIDLGGNSASYYIISLEHDGTLRERPDPFHFCDTYNVAFSFNGCSFCVNEDGIFCGFIGVAVPGACDQLCGSGGSGRNDKNVPYIMLHRGTAPFNNGVMSLLFSRSQGASGNFFCQQYISECRAVIREAIQLP